MKKLHPAMSEDILNAELKQQIGIEASISQKIYGKYYKQGYTYGFPMVKPYSALFSPRTILRT